MNQTLRHCQGQAFLALAADLVGANPAIVKPIPRKRTIGAQLEITELGLKWICDVEFTVSHGEVDDYESLAISSTTAKDCPWIDVEFDNLSEDSKEAIERECTNILEDKV